MKLNHDHVRSLLLFVEESKDNSSRSQAELETFSEQKGITKDEVIYIINRLEEAGFIKSNIQYASSKVYRYSINAITWTGHEYLDNIRDPKIWKLAKRTASKLSGVSLSVMGAIAKETLLKVISGEIAIP